MPFDTTRPGHNDTPALPIDDEPQLVQRLQALGLIEANGTGGWRLTDCCKAGLAALQDSRADASLDVPPVAIRPWKPRRL